MAKNKESIGYVFTVAFAVCLVCAVVVSLSAVALRPIQVENKQRNFKASILSAAGISDPSKSVDELFKQIEPRLVDLKTGKFSDAYDVDTFDPVKATTDPAMSEKLPASEDLAGIKRLEKYSEVYLIHNASGALEKIVLPIRGYGLWSTMWGFIALEGDLNTIAGLGFYQQGETPGLGGEVDNPNWKAQWPGKKLNDDSGKLAIEVTKGGAADPNSPYQVDGLSGATLTTKGVDHLVHFWLGDHGFEPFLKNLKAGDA